MYEPIEHTADVGMRVRAASLEELFCAAARALYSIVFDDLSGIGGGVRRSVEIAGTDPSLLLFDWLNELLYLSAAERVVLDDIEVTLTPGGLEALATAGDAADRQPRLEVKAITYHHLAVRAEEGTWVAEFIVDV